MLNESWLRPNMIFQLQGVGIRRDAYSLAALIWWSTALAALSAGQDEPDGEDEGFCTALAQLRAVALAGFYG